MDLKPTRRRGKELEKAILDAAWAQLTESGYADFTFEGIADRAGTSRTVLYRRWSDREELMKAAVRHAGAAAPIEIPDTGALRDPLQRFRTTWHGFKLDLGLMQEAAATLIGLHDFATYCKPRPGATTIRTLQSFDWRRDPDGVLVATLQADAFCHSMVRALVGACVSVGEGKLVGTRLVDLRVNRARTSEFKVMQPHGLTLMEVGYPEDAGMAIRAAQTRARRELPEDE